MYQIRYHFRDGDSPECYAISDPINNIWTVYIYATSVRISTANRTDGITPRLTQNVPLEVIERAAALQPILFPKIV